MLIITIEVKTKKNKPAIILGDSMIKNINGWVIIYTKW